MKIIHRDSRLDSRRYNSKVTLSKSEVTVVSLRNLLNTQSGRDFIGMYPKLSRVVSGLLDACIGTLPFMYLVNYKVPNNVLVDIKSAGPDSHVEISDVLRINQSDKMHGIICSTQGIFIDASSRDFDASILSKYRIPDVNKHGVYLDLNPLTSSNGGGEVRDPEFYKTSISYHISRQVSKSEGGSIEEHKSKVDVVLPWSINLNRSRRNNSRMHDFRKVNSRRIKLSDNFDDAQAAYEWLQDEEFDVFRYAYLERKGKTIGLSFGYDANSIGESVEKLFIHSNPIPGHFEIVDPDEWQGMIGGMFDYINKVCETKGEDI